MVNLPFVINSIDQPDICLYSPLTQYSSYFRNQPLYFSTYSTLPTNYGSPNSIALTVAEGRNSNACDVMGFCCVLGEPSDGLGEWRGETGPPGAKDDANAFFEGDNGDGCPPREPGGI